MGYVRLSVQVVAVIAGVEVGLRRSSEWSEVVFPIFRCSSRV